MKKLIFVICFFSFFSSLAFSQNPHLKKPAQHKNSFTWELVDKEDPLIFYSVDRSDKDESYYKRRVIDSSVIGMDSSIKYYLRVYDSKEDSDTACVVNNIVFLVTEDRHGGYSVVSQEPIVLPWYMEAWKWYYDIFFQRSSCPFVLLAGAFILAAIAVALISLIVIVIKKTWHFLDYGSAVEIHGTGTIISGEFDRYDEEDDEDNDNIEDADQNESEEGIEDSEEGNGCNFSLQVKISTSVGERTFWWDVSEEVYDKFEINQVVGLTYRIGQISKSIEIISVPQFDN